MGSGKSETIALDLIEFWANKSVASEVRRGEKLREEKPKCSKEADLFTTVDININASVKKTHKYRRGKNKHKQATSSNKNSRCPIRIAELAAPTKRQCIDTWRNSGKTLPNFMVDRLRQHILDQKIAVHINDAIDSFKSNKIKRTRQTKINHRKIDNKVDKVKLFCGLFGHKIALKLLPPGRISVQKSLKNLSEIINNDIDQLLRRGKKDNVNKSIQNEISEKVSVWITSILENSDVNLMMDDLQDLKEKEGHVWDIIDDLVENVLASCNSECISNIDKNSSRTSSFISIESIKSSILSKGETNVYNESITINKSTPETDENKIEMINVILLDLLNIICGYDNQNLFIQNLLEHTISQVITNGNKEIQINNEINTEHIIENQTPLFTDVDQVSVNEFQYNDIDERLALDVTDISKSRTSNLEKQIENTDNEQIDHDVLQKNINNPNYIKNIIINQINNGEIEEGINTIEQTLPIESPVTHPVTDVGQDSVNESYTTHVNNEEINIDVTDIPKIRTEDLEKQIEKRDNQQIDLGKLYDVQHMDTSNTNDLENSIYQSNIETEEGMNNIPPLSQTTEQTQELSNDFNPLSVSETKLGSDNWSNTNISRENMQIRTEEWPDDSLKKVKFSEFNIGNEQRSIGRDAKNDEYESSIMMPENLSLISSSKNYFKNINFSSPNTHLLYNVDETWPEELLPSTTKLSATVSKSVVSLGLINEEDEKSIIPDKITKKDLNIEEHVTDICNLSKEITNDDLQNTYLMNLCNKIDSKDSNNEELLQVSRESESGCSNIEKSHEKGDNEDSNVQNRELKVYVLPCININSEFKLSSHKVLTKDKRIQTGTKQKESKYKPKREQEINCWCKGLHNVVINIEKWLNWIHYVTNIVAAQLRKNDMRCKKMQKDNYLKEWLQLQEDIYSDAKLWHHLYKRLTIGINIYKNCFKDFDIETKPVQPKSCICRGF